MLKIALAPIRSSAFAIVIACALACPSCKSDDAAKSDSGGGGEGGSGGGDDEDAGSVDRCETAADCAYGEIDHEIVKKSDCVCLYGCPYLPLNKTTVDRRKASYKALCDPRTDAKGQPCGIDDCVPLKAIACDDHVCRAAPKP